MNIKVKQFKVPHCCHCAWYKEQTGTCIKALMSQGLNRRAKACSSRRCKCFNPKEEYRQFYLQLLKEKENERP